MDLPQFKYSPNAYQLDFFEEVEGTCSICQKERTIQYTGSFYSIDEPDYICPWCISDGSAAAQYDGEFNDYASIEGVPYEPDEACPIAEEMLEEVATRTPSYTSWQQEVWLCHCNEPCAFLGYADSERIQPLLDELKEDIENCGYSAKQVRSHLTTDGHLVGYLFQCVQCGKHRLHVDAD